MKKRVLEMRETGKEQQAPSGGILLPRAPPSKNGERERYIGGSKSSKPLKRARTLLSLQRFLAVVKVVKR